MQGTATIRLSPRFPILRWGAGADGIAHVRLPGNPRTVCGRIPAPDRFAWPETSRCGVCSAAVEVKP